MNPLGRRALLKFMGIAPAAVPMLNAQVLSTSIAGLGFVGAGGDYGRPVGQTSSAPTRYINFAKWMLEAGEATLRRQSKIFRGFDPDIVEFRLPLQTKMRMQYQRNYERLVAYEKQDFLFRVNKYGTFDWYG